jgi:hypothetical protein
MDEKELLAELVKGQKEQNRLLKQVKFSLLALVLLCVCLLLGFSVFVFKVRPMPLPTTEELRELETLLKEEGAALTQPDLNPFEGK